MTGNFTTTYGDDLLILGASDVVFGTAMLGDEFGTIKKAMVKRTGDRELILNQQGELKLLFIKNPGFELVLEVAFSKHVEAPGLLEIITLPMIGVQGHVMEGVTISWELGDERGMTIPVNSWDVMQNARAYRLLPGSGTLVEINPAPPSLTATVSTSAMTITLAWPAYTGAVNYVLQVSDDGEAWQALTTTASLSFAHTGLSAGQTKFYRLRVTLAEAVTPWSSTVAATTLGAITLVPAFVVQEGSNSNSPRVVGTKVPGAAPYGSQTTGYQVQQATEANMAGAITMEVPPSNLTPTGWTKAGQGVLDDTLYYFRVRAGNFFGFGPWSEILSGRARPHPPVPWSGSTGVLPMTGPVISWFDRGGSRTGFRVALYKDGAESLLATLPATQTTFNLRATTAGVPAGEWAVNVCATRGLIVSEPYGRLVTLPLTGFAIIRADNTTTTVDSTAWTADDFA